MIRWLTQAIGWPRHGTGALDASGIRKLGARLESEKVALQAFTTAMEEEFLTLGTLLRKITTLAGQVRERSDEVMSAAAGRTEDAAIQFAFQLLKKAEDLVQASREQHANVAGVFEKMHVDLRLIAREREVLMQTLSPLETTNTQFRIQACAFDENTRSQFFTLADSIGEIVRNVQTAVGERFEELDRTGQAAGELVDRLTALAAQQKTDTEAMLAATRDHLSSLNQALLSSEAAARSMSQSGEKIAGGVGKTIVALQCQDMARQKLQHISAAIDEMIAHLAPGSASGFRGAQATDCRHFLAGAAGVQLGQLSSVFEQLEQAASQIGQGLEEVQTEAKCFAEGALHSGAAALDGRIISQAIQSIHAVLGVIENAVTSIRGVVDLVQKLKSTFSDCTSQILNLALGLRMVALNAQIFAAHVDAGTALEVVARNTRFIADDAMHHLDGISARVTELVDSVEDLEQRLCDYRELAVMEQKLLADESSESEKKLRNLEQELRTALTAIGPLEKQLSETIRNGIAAIRFRDAVAEANSRSTALFEEIAREYSDIKRYAEAAPHHKLDALKQNYTMAHERVVHESIAGAVGKSAGGEPCPVAEFRVPASPASGEDEETLASNVELF